MRWFAGAIVLALGIAGLIRGAVAQPTPPAAPGTVIAVNGEVRQISRTTAVATMTVYNTTAVADRITGVQSGAGAGGSVPSVVVPAHGNVKLSGARRVVITGLYDTLEPGQYVSIALSLQAAGSVLVNARVVASTGSSGSVTPSTPSGVHS